MKKFAMVLGAVSLAVALTGCTETEVKEVSSEESTQAVADVSAEKEEAPKEEVPQEDKVYKVGDTVSVDGIEITIKSAQFTDPNEYTAPTNGKVLTLEVVAKNTNGEQALIDNTEFAVYDSEGTKMEDYYGYDEMAISDTVNAGKQLKGKLFFDVKEQANYEFIYTPSFTLDSKEVKFDIQVQK